MPAMVLAPLVLKIYARTAYNIQLCCTLQIGGISVAELSAMELHMLRLLGYRLFVREEEVAHRLREVKVCATLQLSCLPASQELAAFLYKRLAWVTHCAKRVCLCSLQQLQLTCLAHPPAGARKGQPGMQ